MADYSYQGTGGIHVSGSAGYSRDMFISVPLTWNINGSLTVSNAFSWNTGLLPLRWWQVEGCCRYPTDPSGPTGGAITDPGGCDVLPIQYDNCPRPQTFIQSVLARNIGEVCEILKTNGWLWPICAMKKFAKAGENRFVTPGACNTLTLQEFCDVPPCMEFCLQTDGRVNMAASVSVIDYNNTQIGHGGITISGSAGCRVISPLGVGSGGITMGGSAGVTSTKWTCVGSGGITMGGSAGAAPAISHWSYVGSGGITVSGGAVNVSPAWNYSGSGSIITGGSARCIQRLYAVGSGGITMGGAAIYPYRLRGSGGITMGGAAGAKVLVWRYVGSGGITMAGNSPSRSPSYHYAGSGGMTVGGSSEVNIGSWRYSGSGEITMGGEAGTRSSEDGDFWYRADGGISVAGAAECAVSKWNYVGGGGISLAGEGGIDSSWKGEFTAEAGLTATVVGLEPIFGGGEAEDLIVTNTNIRTNCGNCTNLPPILYFSHNLRNGNFLKDFLSRNGFVLPTTIPMFYSRRADSWQGGVHFVGTGDNNNRQQESWRMVVEWQCVNELASSPLGSYVWKCSFYINRKNTTTGMDFDTRFLAAFPPGPMCANQSRLGLKFPFRVDTTKKKIYTDMDIVVDVRLIYDNIGLFRSKYWNGNPLRLTVSQAPNPFQVERADASQLLESNLEPV